MPFQTMLMRVPALKRLCGVCRVAQWGGRTRASNAPRLHPRQRTAHLGGLPKRLPQASCSRRTPSVSTRRPSDVPRPAPILARGFSSCPRIVVAHFDNCPSSTTVVARAAGAGAAAGAGSRWGSGVTTGSTAAAVAGAGAVPPSALLLLSSATQRRHRRGCRCAGGAHGVCGGTSRRRRSRPQAQTSVAARSLWVGSRRAHAFARICARHPWL